MSFLNSFILGVVQAATEFLPVSSSAHLKLAKALLQEDGGVLVDLSCHLGTLCALIIFLRKDIFSLLFKEPKKLIFFFLALIPLVPFYFLLQPFREYASQIHLLGFCLMATGALLLAGQFIRIKRLEKTGFARHAGDALMIGALQSAALIPGISRSASTISCARILGKTPKEAVRFSFLLSIPTVLGGNLREFTKAAQADLPSIPFASLGISFAASFLFGLFAAGKIIPVLERGNLKPWAIYCLVLGTALTIYYNL